MKAILTLCFSLTVSVFIVHGCGPEIVTTTWSPDGKIGSIFLEDKTYFFSPDGKLQNIIDSTQIAWAPKTHDIYYVTSTNISSWKDLLPYLKDDEQKRIASQADIALNNVTVANMKDFAKNPFMNGNSCEATMMLLYIKDHYPKSPKVKIISQNWQDVSKASISLKKLLVCRNFDLAAPQLILQSFLNMDSLRISPNQKAFLFISDKTLYVCDMKGQYMAIEKYVSAFPDWTPDGTSIIYCSDKSVPLSSYSVKNDASSSADSIGYIKLLKVCDEKGGDLLTKFPDQQILVKTVFSEFCRMRCLKNGDFLFTSPQVTLPSAYDTEDSVSQLYAITPTISKNPFAILPQNIQNSTKGILWDSFELSPDQKRVAVMGEKSIVILTLETGNITTIESELKDMVWIWPSWQNNDTLCIVTSSKTADGKTQANVMLWSEKGSKIISDGWPADVKKSLNASLKEEIRKANEPQPSSMPVKK